VAPRPEDLVTRGVAVQSIRNHNHVLVLSGMPDRRQSGFTRDVGA
jgi:hypothetical protein